MVNVNGTNGDDLIVPGDNPAGNNDFTGNDRINGRGGNDFLDGGGGNDRVNGQDGNDYVIGGDGNDDLRGGAGIDVLEGRTGDDRLRGQDDVDVLNGGEGNDTLSGGGGADQFYFEGGELEGFDEVTDFVLGEDVLEFNSTTLTEGGIFFQILLGRIFASGDDAVIGTNEGDGAVQLNGVSYLDLFNQIVQVGFETAIWVEPGSAAVAGVSASASDPEPFALPAPAMFVSEEEEEIEPLREDRIDFGDFSNFQLIESDRGNDSFIGIEGTDIIVTGRGRDTVDGGAGNDFLSGDSGRDSLLGGDGNDMLFGGGGRDTLEGGEGDDLLHGGNGNDWLTGDAGADVFVFSGRDRVTDFTDGEDRIAVLDARGAVFEDLRISLKGDTTVVTLGNRRVDLRDFTGSLDANDFIFVEDTNYFDLNSLG